MRRFLIGTAALCLSACYHVGTKVTVGAERGKAVRAIDQQLVADAVDAGFAGLEIPKLGAPAGKPAGTPYTAYVTVASVMPIGNDLREYIGSRAAAAASAAGLAVREVRVVRERTGPVEREWLETPDTDARVLVMVSYAGVDQVDAPGVPRSTDRSQLAVAGRFKATLSIVPRTSDRPLWSGTFTGEKKLSLDDVKYWDAR